MEITLVHYSDPTVHLFNETLFSKHREAVHRGLSVRENEKSQKFQIRNFLIRDLAIP